MSLDAFGHLFVDYGYSIVFAAIALETAGLPLPGELLLFAFGHLARHSSHLNPLVGVLVAFWAAVVGDSVGYWVGRVGGQPILARLGIRRQLAFRRRFLVCGRFLVGVRLLIAPLAGCGRVPYPTFLLFDGLGAILWTSVFVLAGYSLNVRFEVVSDAIQAFRTPLALLIGLAVALCLVVRWGLDSTPWLRRWSRLEAQRIATGRGSTMRILALALGCVLATASSNALAHESGDADHDHSFDASDPSNDPTLRAMSTPHVMANPHLRMTARRPASREDQERAERVLAILREVLEKYRDSDVAERDGYKPFMPNPRVPVYHFTNKRYGAESAFRFDPEHPTSLLYKRAPGGYELIGAMYSAPGRATEEQLDARVPLSVGQWHLHVNICAEPGGNALVSKDRRFGLGGSIATREECDAANGRFLPRIFGWMLHVQPFGRDPKDIWGDSN